MEQAWQHLQEVVLAQGRFGQELQLQNLGLQLRQVAQELHPQQGQLVQEIAKTKRR